MRAPLGAFALFIRSAPGRARGMSGHAWCFFFGLTDFFLGLTLLPFVAMSAIWFEEMLLRRAFFFSAIGENT